ncbi:beta strand repeat-containing protein, partial [Cetobacterium sp.]|uniref:beta strand repeat-containing protein n=2 Tax=Cetobacterium sp. TaxID=2071632 RepID=UPI003F67F979
DTGETLRFKVRIANPGPTALTNIKIEAPLSGITSTLDGGGSGAAFSTFVNQISSSSPGANPGSIPINGDFSVNGVDIPADGYVEYFVRGTVNSYVKDPLTPVVTVTNTSSNTILGTGSVTLTRVPYTYTIGKSSTNTYYEKDGIVSYKITVTNTSTSTTIKDFRVDDILSTDLTGATITATSTGGSSAGSFSPSGDLIATGITITPGSKVEYTITANIKQGVTGSIQNTATSTVRAQTESSNTVTLNLATYDFSIQKTSTPTNYTPNENLTYKVRVQNNSSTVGITKMKVEDILSTLTATAADGSTKAVFAPGTITVTAIGTGGSNAGIFNPTGDLTATNVSISPSSYVEYTIIGKVNSDIVGQISNIVKATDRNGVEKTTALNTTSVLPIMNLTKTQNKTTYRPGEIIIYTVTVENTGTGIASNYVVEDLLAGISGNTGNTGITSATDLTSGLLKSWTVNAALGAGSTKSISTIVSNGGTTTNTNLLDVVTVFPGEKIVYTITAVAKDSAISNIVNTANLKKNAVTEKTASVTAAPVALATNSTVVITKVPNQIEYKPGDIITYTITVTNPNNNFMNNLSIKDAITSILAEQVNGTSAPAFDSWDLSVISTTGVGTVSGTPNTTNNTGDLLITADIGANGTIVYEIKAKTKLSTIGLIQDIVTTGGDNVPETGPGVKMSSPILEVAKNVNSTEYVPGGTLVYTIDVDNPGDGYATGVKVEDKLSTITALLIDGTTGPAYQSWNITSAIYDISSGSPVLVTSSSEPSNAGTYSPTSDLNITNAILGPNRRVTYTVTAVLNPKAKGSIKNLATVNGAVYSDKGSLTRESKVNIAKSTPTVTYAAGGTATIQYEVVVGNSGTAGVALGVKVEDKISAIQGVLLGSGALSNAFSSWTIATPILNGSETKSTITSSLNNVDLNDTVDISPGGSVKYVITATLKSPTATEILYGAITNTAKADTLTASATTIPKLPSLSTTKTALVNTFIPGSPVSFKITVTNNGDGYANDAIIKDVINSTYFENIIITGTAVGLGTTTGISGSINTNLNATVDIAPGGKVEYTVVATVKAAYTGNTVSNTAEVTDTQNNLTTTTSATITKSTGGGSLIDFIKRSDSTTFEPGGTITYFIDIKNKLAIPREVTVKDLISNIKATYANDLNQENVTDLLNQNAFTSWIIYKGENNSNPSTTFGSPSTDLNDTVTISANSTMTYKIVAVVNDRVVTQQLTNVVTLLEGANQIGISSIQHNIVPPGGGVTREVDKVTYIPGVDKIKYTITAASTGPGYQNNLSISELVRDLTVPLIDGTSDNPFKDPVTGAYNFTVKKIVTNETDGTEQVFTVGIADNQNLVGTVDIKPGEKLQYVIEGLVRKDAIGTINNSGLITEPFRHNLQNTKSVTPSKYQPGQYITYTIILRNNSNGNAKDIPVVDNFSTITVLDSTGTVITPALTDITVDLLNSSAIGYKANLGNPTITNGVLNATPDIPIGGVITYKIKAKVDDKAVAFITNTAVVDGDAVSNQVGPSTDKPEIKKEVLKFYKPDGTTAITNRYMPGGYIEYKVTLKNTGTGILNNAVFTDEIGAITTSYATTGVTGPAFDSWTVTKLSQTGVSTVADINNTIPLATLIPNTAAKPKIEGLMDIHPGGEIVYVIKAKINENAIGNITNIGSLNGLKSSITSTMQTATINHTKQAYELDGTTVKNTFYPGDDVVYKIRVENTGLGTSASKTYRDIVGNIVGEIAETTGSTAIPTSNVFASYTATYTTSGGNVTTVGTFNTTIDLQGSVTISPGGWIEFVITGKLKDTIIGKFTNTSTYDTNTKTKELTPLPTTITVNKTLTKLGTADFVAGMTYTPGDFVEYTIEIENTGRSFYNNLSIGDNVDAIVTSLTGDATGKALENVVISVPTVTNTVSKPVLTDIKAAAGNTSTNLQAEVDFAPKDKIVYKITGNIVKSAIGVIPANILTVAGTNYPSAQINPKSPIITTKKELIAPADRIYGPNEVVEYKLTVENTGEGYGNDIKIVDKISDIKTTLLNGTQGQAFVNWTITSVISHTDSTYNGKTIVQNAFVDNNNIDTEVDIAPTGKLEITIKATTSSLAAGEIINTAKLNNEDKSSDPINPRIATVDFNKLPLLNGETTYVPNGDIGFRLVITNTSENAIAKDINISDIVSGIQVQSAIGGTVAAFQPGWIYEIVSVSGDTTKYSTTGIGSGGDITAGKITLAPKEILVVRIKGKANNLAVGNIVNTANASYNGTNLGPKTVTLTPKAGVADLTKSVNKVEYTPGGKILYTIVVKNTGAGYLNDVSIVDDLLKIQTDLANGTKGPAITAITQVTFSKLNAATTIARDLSYTDGYKATGDIYPGDTVTIVLEATVNPLAAGTIINVANVKDSTGTILDTDTKTVSPLPANLKILKTVDKTTYVSGDTLTYKIIVGNIGTGWANGIKVTDEISSIISKVAGTDVPAFESWTISYVPSAGSGQVIVSEQTFPLTTQDLNARVSLAPQSGVEFTIVAKLVDNTTGDIKNIAKYQYDPTNPTNPGTTPVSSNEVVTKPQVIPLQITKSQSNPREQLGDATAIPSASNYEIGPIKYWLSDIVYYRIQVTSGASAVDNVTIRDNLKDVLVFGSGGSNIPAFSEWSIQSINYSGTGITSPTSSIPAVGSTTTASNISVTTNLGSNQTMTIIIKAKITAGDVANANFPQAVIKNTASLETLVSGSNVVQNSNEVVFTPYPPVLERDKVITSINGVPYTAGMTYEPGDIVVYTLSIKNISGGVADDVIIKDNISSVVTELVGGGVGQAFSSWTITVDKSPAAKITPESFAPNTNIDALADLGPDKYVNFIISATVASNAIGTISPNIGIINGEDDPTPPIPPKTPTAPTLIKTIKQGSVFTPGGTIIYEVKVTNPNEKLWLNDVNVLDSISSIKAYDLNGNLISAFKSNWTIGKVDLGKGTLFTNTYPKSNVDLNEMMDLAPTDVVTFTITGIVNDNIVGDIVNKASGSYIFKKEIKPLPEITVTSTTNPGVAKITKVPFEEFYIPGGTIGYDITIENTSSTNLINDLKLTDLISGITASKIGEANPVAAFKPNWTISYQVIGDTVNTNTTEIPSTGDINNINLDIGKSTKIIIRIRGIAEDGIYGDILNTATYTYPDNNPNNTATATIKPRDPEVVLRKTVNVPTYGPTDLILYTVELENIGTGPAIGVKLLDEIGLITTDLTGTPTTGKAFSSWERELTSVPNTSVITLETITADAYSATLNIAPGDKVIITLKGTLNPKAYGEIKNIASGSYRNGKNEEIPLTANAITKGKSPQLFIRKQIDKNIYEDGDTLVFTVLLQNGGLGWGNDVIVQDKITEIKDDLVGQAFESWTIAIQSSSPLSSVSPNPIAPTTNLDVLVDIAPLSQVKFTITAKLAPNVSSTIKNTAIMKEKPDGLEKPSEEVVANPLTGNISVIKSVLEAKYTPGGKLTYVIEVKNSANILARDVLIKDSLNGLDVTTNLGQAIDPFITWRLLNISGSAGTLYTSALPEPGAAPGIQDLEVKTNIKPGETITLTIEADVSAGTEEKGVPVGPLENKVTVTYLESEIFDTVQILPGDPKIIIDKKIVSLAGAEFTGQKYKSGDEVVYEITIQNTGAGMASDVAIDDIISSMTTELAGGIVGPAFETWTIDIFKDKATTLITPATLDPKSDVALNADIDVNGKIVITVTAKINSKAVGVIPKNIVTVQNVKKDTPEIDPEKGELSFKKKILEGENYTQGGTIKYELRIINKSATYINDVNFRDEISLIKAKGLNESLVPAFLSWTVTRTDNNTGTQYTQGESLVTTDIDTQIDLSPNDTVVYIVTAIVNENVVGEIENIGYVDYIGPDGVIRLEEKVIALNTPAEVKVEKEPIVTEYVPGGEIGFRIILENTSEISVANNIAIKDIISSIMANKIGGGTTGAFKTNWVITATLNGDVSNSDINSLTSLDVGKDIDNLVVDLGKKTKVTIDIKGYAADDIYGDILNTVSFDYPEGQQTGKDDAVIKNTPSKAELSKQVDKVQYNSGEQLEYTITIKNTGKSAIPNFVLTDEIGKVIGELSGASTSTGLAFVSWERVSLSVPDSTSVLEEIIKSSLDGDTYSLKIDLGPEDEVVVKLSAVTKTNVFGELKNIAIGKYPTVENGQPKEETLTSEAISNGKVGVLQLTKTVEPILYTPGQEVQYTIVVSNSGEGWVRNATLRDMFSEIKTIVYPGVEGLAFDSSSLSVTYTTTENENSVTLVESNPNLIADIDIKNGSSITFIAKIKVLPEAVQMIENIAKLSVKVGEEEELIEAKAKVFPKLPQITLKKTVDVQTFELSQNIIYTIVLENIGDTNVVGIEGRDIIQDIRAMNNLGELVYPFEAGGTITRVIEPADSVKVTPQVGAEGNLTDNLDMKAKSKITYTIELKVKDSIVGNIENTVKAKVPKQGSEEPTELVSTVTSNPLRPTLGIEKTVITAIEADNGIINGEEVTYTIKLTTNRSVFNVQLIDEIVELKNEAGENIFKPDSIDLISVQENGVNVPYTGDINGSSSEIKISRINSEALIVIKAIVKDDITLRSGEAIDNVARANYDQENDNVFDLETPIKDNADVVARAPELELTKVATQDEILLGEEVEYTIKVKNTGVAKATNFIIVDNISEMTELSNSGVKIPAYTEWTVTGTTGPNSKLGTLPAPNTDINIKDAEIAPGDTLIYIIKAKTSLDLNAKEVKNTVKITIPGLPDKKAEDEIKVKKPLVSIDKEAGVRETSVGKFVPYSLLVTNNESQIIKNLYIRDTPPAGFEYVEDSLQIVKNGEKIGTIPTTYSGDTIVIGPFNLEAREQIEVVYITRVSVGVVKGVYKNVAVVTNGSGKPISNEDSAEVDVVEDPLFETTTVIGKVFHDRDGDGIQDDSRATGLVVTQNINDSSYVPNSTYYVINGIRKAVPDRSVPLVKGVKFKETLYGRDSEKDELEKSKVEIFVGLKDLSSLGDIKVVTNEGTDVTLTKDNRVITNHKGLKAKGMVSQNIVVRREILKRSTNKNPDNKINYYQKITIINTGVIEEGIPGVRIANVEGLVIITDQYGRFHIPEVSSKKGKNYILKVDEATLPTGTIFTTENPKVQRLGTTMIKYNFGVVLPRTTFETKKDGTRLLKVRVYPGVIFYDNSDEIKPVVYKNLFEAIVGKIKSKDHLLVELNRSGDEKLDEKRKAALVKSLEEYLKKEKVNVELVQTKKEGR